MKRAVFMLSIALGLSVTGGARVSAEELAAADAAVPATKPMSLWNFFGVPQGSQKVRDARLNRLGNNPQRERVDPLKRIADPANLESDNPAIKTAAQAKAEADLAPQKIKAIKFLATVCCCCSQYKKDVKQALLAALSDCTEEVRYAAAVALCQCSGNPCTTCNRCSCCDPDIMGKLAELADGKSPSGCYLESSPRVRAAARNALAGCEEVFRPTGPGPATPTPAPPEAPPERRQPTPAKPDANQTSAIDVRASLASWDEARVATANAARSEAGGPDSGYAEAGDDLKLFPRETIQPVGGDFSLVAYQPQAPAFQPVVEPPVSLIDTLAPTLGGGMVGFTSASLQEAAVAPILASGVPGGVTRGGEIATQGSTDAAQALQESNSVQSVDVQRRSPVALDPHIRGYKGAQIYAQGDGMFWTPARLDLDTMLNKIDPTMIQSAVVVPGPYGLRYGPGLAYVDVERAPVPRSEFFTNEFESNFYFRTNGNQFYGRETATASGPDYGFRASYGARTGSDYTAGNGLRIPSSYSKQDVWADYSRDLNEYQRLDFSFMHLDQGYTEYPCQFFNIDNLLTNGYNLRLVDTNPSARWSKLTMQTWYNQTRFDGSTINKRLSYFPELQRVDTALWNEFNPVPKPAGYFNTHQGLNGTTAGNLFTTGGRAETVFGDSDDSHLNVGTDIRHTGQRIVENFTVDPTVIENFPPPTSFSTNMPRAWSTDPGLYAEWINPITENWTATVGARADFVWTTARFGDVRPNGLLAAEINSPSDLDQYNTLYAFYYTNKWDLDEHWSLTGGFGYGQRPPSLIERYADGLFLSMAQSGYTRMVGNPFLQPERDWQIDVGMAVKQDDWRAGARFYHAWVQDYVTYADDTVASFADARLLYFFNTPLATLTGVELNWEYDLTQRLTPFASMFYTEGRDQTIGQPLPSIPPFDSTVGVRLHDCEKGRQWGVEVAARMVGTQNRLGQIRVANSTQITGQGGVPSFEERTPGFTVCNVRAYWNVKKNLNLIGGIDNVFDRTYQEHLDLRLLGPTGFSASPTRVLEAGFTPYAGVNWIF